MKYIGILLGLLLWPAACMAPPTYGPYPTGGGGLSSNEVYAIALSIGGPTNGISAATATNIVNNNNAASATWATNLNAPYGFSQVLVSSPTNNSVESHGGFTYTQSTNTSVLVVGDAWDIGNPLARRGIITLFDPTAELEASITITNGRLTFPEGIELRGDIQNYTRINGIQHNLLKPEWHNSIEPIYYWGASTLAAQAWTVGSFEEGQTNGRFSFLVGELGLSWNIGRSTNGGVDQSFLVAGTSTNIASWMSGASGPELKAALTYRHDDNRNIIGGTSRGTTIAGTNVVIAVGTNSITVATNAITVLGDVTFGSSAYGLSGLSFWDPLYETYRDFRFDPDLEAFKFGFGIASLGNIVALGSSVFYGNGSGITNLSAEAISGDLSVDTLTATTLNVDAINGNGSGITNSPYALFHETLANNVAPRFIAQVAWTNVIFTTNSFNSDTAGAFTQSNSFLIVNAAGAGTWKVRGNVVIHNNSGNTGAVTPRLYRWSSASTLIAGLTAYQYNYNAVVAGVVGVVTLTAGDILGLQVFAANTTTTTVGRQQNSGIDASSAYIEFERK